ncbi:hypothetical protein JCM1840_001757 [Sporobolomyces johnsonii]
MDQADLESAAVKDELLGGLEQPTTSAAEAELEVARRALADLEARTAALRRILGDKAPAPTLLEDEAPASSDDGEDDEVPVPALASLSVKIKATPPSHWKGDYDHVRREAWIETAEGYFAAIGLDTQARLSKSLTPHPFHIVRSLFSPELFNGFSALAWFDARQRREPFSSVAQVFEAIHSHWRDDHAAEAALQAYRTARQGSLRARDYGSRLSTLADACFDRAIPEADRVSTFVFGLNPNYKEYLKSQVALLSKMGKAPVSLQEHVDLAAVADGLDSFSSLLKRSGGVSSSTSPSPAPAQKKSVSGAHGTPSLSPAGSALEGRTAKWRARAEEWQTSHPVASRAEWQRAGDCQPPQPQHCYNCGQYASHFSASCPAARRDPRTVTILAAVRFNQLSSVVPSASSPLSMGEVEDLDLDVGSQGKGSDV